MSDGNYTWDWVPTIDGLDPSGNHFHCSERSEDGTRDQEYVEVDSLVPKAVLNACAICRLHGAPIE